MSKQPSIADVLRLADNMNREEFADWLQDHGFISQSISTKRVFIGKSFVVKFDLPSWDMPGYLPVRYEYMNRRRVQKWKRRWLARTLGWRNGVLIQECVAACNSRLHWDAPCCIKAERLAHRLRILDWFNHGRRADGSIVFFDFDSYGSGWWNWHARKLAS